MVVILTRRTLYNWLLVIPSLPLLFQHLSLCIKETLISQTGGVSAAAGQLCCVKVRAGIIPTTTQ